MRRIWDALLSARAWCGFAALLVLAFAIAHALGWRDDTRIISGANVPGGAAGDWMAVRGVTYGVTYFGAMVASPILSIAAGLRALAGWAVAMARCARAR